MFNPLDTLHDLRATKLTDEQSEAIVRALQKTAELPDVTQLATKADVEALRASTKSDIEVLRASTKADIEALRVWTKAEFDVLRSSMKADIATSTNRMIWWIVGAVAVSSGLGPVMTLLSKALHLG